MNDRRTCVYKMDSCKAKNFFLLCAAARFIKQLESSRVIYIFFVLFVVRAEEDSEMTAEKPKFITKGQIFRVVIGDTARLPCQVDDLGKSSHDKEAFSLPPSTHPLK